MPVEARQEIEQEDEIFGFLRQSHISDKNMKRLEVLKASPNAKISEYASIVFEVAKVKPFKRRRLKVLGEQRNDLLTKLNETGLVLAHRY